MRAEGWETTLAAFLDEAKDKPFAWGERDCALWASEWVLLCTGEDYVNDWKGTYDSEIGAQRAMLKRGFSNVEEIAGHHLEEKPVTLAKRGDLILHPHGPLGVCNGRFSHFITHQGLTQVETLACPKAWGVD